MNREEFDQRCGGLAPRDSRPLGLQSRPVASPDQYSTDRKRASARGFRSQIDLGSAVVVRLSAASVFREAAELE